MKLFEYEAKGVLSKYGIPIPRGGLVTTFTKAKDVAKDVGLPCVVKAQALVAGRGRAGGIVMAESLADVEEAAKRLLGSKVAGARVKSVWIEEKLPIRRELYLGITVDRSRKSYVAIASPIGGVEVEEVAATMPEKVIRHYVDPVQGFRPYHARQLTKRLGYEGERMIELASIFHNVYKAAMDNDAELLEINPLIETLDGRFVAADARLIVDDNALYRRPEYKGKPMEEREDLSLEEVEAMRSGLAYVKLEGDIGVIGNGAGMVMATMDLLTLYGGRPANFLDVGGGASSDRIAAALRIVALDPNVSVIFMNILGGITRCDEVAKGILEAKRILRLEKQIVIRLSGTKEEEGRRILEEAGIHAISNMEEAAKKVVEIAKRNV